MSEIKNKDLVTAVRRAIVKDQLAALRKQHVQRLTLLPEDEPKPLTRWQRVRAVLRHHWAVAKARLSRKTP